MSPKSNDATGRLAAWIHFNQMLAGPDGRCLYGIDVGDPLRKQVQIVKVDASSGAVIQSKRLDDGVWFLTAGTIPPAMAGRLDLRAAIR